MSAFSALEYWHQGYGRPVFVKCSPTIEWRWAGGVFRAFSVQGGAVGPLTVEAQLMYQPIAFRWAHNLAPHKASEPQWMLKYFDEHAGQSAIVLARAEVSGSQPDTIPLAKAVDPK